MGFSMKIPDFMEWNAEKHPFDFKGALIREPTWHLPALWTTFGTLLADASKHCTWHLTSFLAKHMYIFNYWQCKGQGRLNSIAIQKKQWILRTCCACLSIILLQEKHFSSKFSWLLCRFAHVCFSFRIGTVRQAHASKRFCRLSTLSKE